MLFSISIALALKPLKPKYNSGWASSAILFIRSRPHVRTTLFNERDLCSEIIFYCGADFGSDAA